MAGCEHRHVACVGDLDEVVWSRNAIRENDCRRSRRKQAIDEFPRRFLRAAKGRCFELAQNLHTVRVSQIEVADERC